MTTVWDVFPYWRERWAAEARLALWSTLAPDVDYRPVAFLGDRTHRGGPLPVDLPPVPDGVETVTVRLTASDDWGREMQQRDAVTTLLSRMQPDDLVLLCDADEIADPRKLDEILAATVHRPCKLAMRLWYYGTRWRAPDWWAHPAACRARDLPEHPSRRLRLSGWPAVLDAGWHISWTGSDEDRSAKISAFAHSELDNPQGRAAVAYGAAHGLDPHGRPLLDDPLTGPLMEVLHAAS